MKVLILCGGYGSRLGAAGGDLPKPMVAVGGKPIVWHIMRGFAHWGFREFVLCLGYRSDLFKQYFLNLSMMVGDVTLNLAHGLQPTLHHRGPEAEWIVTLADTGMDAMTGARVKRAGAFVPPDDDIFAVTYGDGVCDVDFRKVVDFHRAHGRIATVTAVHPPGRFGELALGADGKVGEFNEKPQASAGWISGGFFLFSRSFLERLPDRTDLMLEREPLQQLAREGQLMAYCHDDFWFCMGTGLFQAGPACAMFRTDVYRRLGGFPDSGVASDYLFWIHACATENVLLVPGDLFYYRVHPNQEYANADNLVQYAKARAAAWNMLNSSQCPLDPALLDRAKSNFLWAATRDAYRQFKRGRFGAAAAIVRLLGLDIGDWIRYLRPPNRNPNAGTPVES